ncbi:PIR protein [Plasmodium yoelii]|uniref:PIR protein n=2 Tax=Plasmodium yoelii TaxID=5861 RepID=A0AAF0B257_PLAYO|nr:PIR protein [Plasmodium yoelii]WBY59667.1 PIR protein [Plasmodium yoelii yoelii]VTZ80406.1 PIR protein [Plasmodium yoelii]|eukprot:XP_022813469.1 PIR protein [Plasmodium yoelii]
MNDTLCGQFDFVRKYFPDNSSDIATLDFDDNSDLMKYCTNKDSGVNKCDTDLDKITAGFLWLLAQYYSMSKDRTYSENNTNPFFLYMISWFSYKIKQKSNHENTPLYDYYNKNVKNNNKYSSFTNPAYTITDIEDVLDKKSEFLNINIEDLSNFYDAFKLLCNIHSNIAQNKTDVLLPNSATNFVKKYAELTNKYNIKNTACSKILSALSTDYNNLKNNCNSKGVRCKDFPSIPETPESISALLSGDTSSSSIGKRLFTVLSIFGAIAFFLGISYKYSLFGFRKRFKKQHIREKIKNIKKKMNR